MSDVTDLKAELLLLRRENTELREQNDKLRELVNDILDRAWSLENLDLEWRFRDELRELGVTA